MVGQTARYALRALIFLALHRHGDYMQTRQIADATGVPANYLGKILQKLARYRILDSQKGMGGGFHLLRAPQNVTLYEIFQAIDALPCGLCEQVQDAVPAAEINLATLQSRLNGINNMYTQFLKQATLAQMMQEELAPNLVIGAAV